MPATVLVNNLTVVHKDSGGVTMIFPDVCKTPAPAGPIPLPYPNTAMSADTADGSSSVLMNGNPVMLKSSCFAKSVGDEAGSAMGVVSNKISGKAYPKTYSFDVSVEGESVMRVTDIMLQNGGSPTNTGPGTEVQANTVVVEGPGEQAPKDPEKEEVTDLYWTAEEAACGDPIVLNVRTKNVADGYELPVDVVRDSSTRNMSARLRVPIKANYSNYKWLVRRGPWEKTVNLLAEQDRVDKGVKRSPKTMMVRSVEDVKELIGPKNRTAPRYKLSDYSDDWEPTGEYFEWEYCYSIEVKDGQLIITRRIDFDTQPAGWRPTRRQMKNWRRQIEKVWNRRFKIHREDCGRGDGCNCPSQHGCCAFAIRVRCEFGPGHGQKVRLHRGPNDPKNWGGTDWWYSNDWWEGTRGVPGAVRAHEFGHLIGMFDEYPKGACHSSRTHADVPPSLMNRGRKLFQRHFEDFEDWFFLKEGEYIGYTKLIADI